VATIIQMVAQTRLDCAAGSAGLMRQALVQAIFHCRHRAAFGRKLVEQPLMQRVLADLALESEAALALTLRVAHSFDHAEQESERSFSRLATPIAKYWVTRRAPRFTFEAMECLGGAGYVEESPLPRLYREAPVNSIWEGSGNVQCLDVLRAVQRDPSTLEAFLGELERARGGDAHYDRQLDRVRDAAIRGTRDEANARHWVEVLALTLSASLLIRHAPPEVSSSYCAARLGPERGLEYGALPAPSQAPSLLDRAF
jgi:putative acyl-CoA dehydrogenase